MVSTTNTSLVVSADEVFDEMTMNKFLKRECTVDEYYAYYTSTVSNKDWSERYTIGLFVFGLQSEIGKRVEMYNPNSLLDAYHLARWQETMNDIMRKNSSTSLSSSSKIDQSKAEKGDTVELEFCGDGKGNKGQSSGEEINKFGVKFLEVPREEHVEERGMKSKGSNELDDKNMDKVSLDSSKDADTGEAFSNDIKIDSKGWVAGDSSCDESELESIVSCKVDVDGMVNCEEDGKDNEADVSKNGAEYVVMDVGEFLNGKDENLVCKSNVGSLVVGHESNIFEVDKESGTISVYDSSVHDFSKRVLTCDDMFYKNWNLKDLTEVIDTTKDSNVLLELSKEVDQDNHGLEGNFMGDSGLGNDVDGFVLLGRTTLVENTKTSVINVQENNAYNILKNQ
ncbi:hypothetical protein Tco_0755008, partial [Tanacetum coccineum]